MDEQELMAAAMAAYEAHGAKLSISEIARRAGTSRQTIYQHLGDKAAILEAIAARLGESSGPQDTDGRIMEAVLSVAAQRGFRAASLEEIAQAAGVAAVTIYRRFGSKDELIRAFVLSRSPAPALDEILAVELVDAAQTMRELTERLLRFMDAHRELVRLVISGSADDRAYLDELRGATARTSARLVVLFEQLEQRGALRVALPPAQLATSYFGMIYAHAVLSVSRQPLQIPQVAQGIVSLLISTQEAQR